MPDKPKANDRSQETVSGLMNMTAQIDQDILATETKIQELQKKLEGLKSAKEVYRQRIEIAARANAQLESHEPTAEEKSRLLSLLKANDKIARLPGINWVEIEESLNQNPAIQKALVRMVEEGSSPMVFQKRTVNKRLITGVYPQSEYVIGDSAEIPRENHVEFDAADRKRKELGAEFLDGSNFVKLMEYRPGVKFGDTWAALNEVSRQELDDNQAVVKFPKGNLQIGTAIISRKMKAAARFLLALPVIDSRELLENFLKATGKASVRRRISKNVIANRQYDHQFRNKPEALTDSELNLIRKAFESNPMLVVQLENLRRTGCTPLIAAVNEEIDGVEYLVLGVNDGREKAFAGSEGVGAICRQTGLRLMNFEEACVSGGCRTAAHAWSSGSLWLDSPENNENTVCRGRTTFWEAVETPNYLTVPKRTVIETEMTSSSEKAGMFLCFSFKVNR